MTRAENRPLAAQHEHFRESLSLFTPDLGVKQPRILFISSLKFRQNLGLEGGQYVQFPRRRGVEVDELLPERAKDREGQGVAASRILEAEVGGAGG